MSATALCPDSLGKSAPSRPTAHPGCPCPCLVGQVEYIAFLGSVVGMESPTVIDAKEKIKALDTEQTDGSLSEKEVAAKPIPWDLIASSIAPLPLRYHFSIAPSSLHHHSIITPSSLHHHPIITSSPLHHHSITTPSPLHHVLLSRDLPARGEQRCGERGVRGRAAVRQHA